MLLYDSAVSGNCYKVRLLLAHLSVSYERREVDVDDRSGRLELLGELNPGLRVPTIVLHDGRSLGESGAILWLFADGTPYLPADRFERAQVLQWMFFEQYSHEPHLAVVRFWTLFPAHMPDQQVVEQKRAAGYTALDAMERHLTANEFFVAGRYSIADIALYAYTHVAHEADFDLAAYPEINAWMARVAAQPRHVTIDA